MKFSGSASRVSAGCLFSGLMLLCSGGVYAQNIITALNVGYNSNTTIIKIDLARPLSRVPDTEFIIGSSPHIVLEFPDTENGLDEPVQDFTEGGLRSANIVQSGGRTRLVLYLNQMFPSSTRIDGNSLLITLQGNAGNASGVALRPAETKQDAQRLALNSEAEARLKAEQEAQAAAEKITRRAAEAEAAKIMAKEEAKAARLLAEQQAKAQAEKPVTAEKQTVAKTEPARLKTEPVKFNIAEFQIEGNTLLPVDEIRSALSPFTGTDREMADVNKAVEALSALYHEAGYPVVQVVFPVQTMTSSKALLKVVEDKIALIEVKGNVVYGAGNIRASLPPLQTGKSLNANKLEAAIALANENPAKQVAVNVQPGAQPGDINTRIDVTEDRISRLIATYDNTGSSATGFNKAGLAYQNANLFNLDHALTLQYNGSLDYLDKVYSLSLGYHIPFYKQGLSADLIAAYSSSSGQNVNLYFSGKGTVFGARLNYALTSMGDIRHKLIFGADYKDSESVAGPLVTPITETPISLAYYAQVARPEFQGNGSIAFISNIKGGQHGATTDYYNPATFTGARVPASGNTSTIFPGTNWRAWRINGSGGFALPQDWQARVGVNSQFSRDLLLPSEQFGAGGATAFVRGYPERIISGDEGYTANFELYSPDMNKYMDMPESSLRALMFWDVGSVSLNDKPLPVGMNRRTSIDGMGLGFRLTHKKNINLKLDIGWAQKQVGYAPLTVYRGDAFGNVSLSVTE